MPMPVPFPAPAAQPEITRLRERIRVLEQGAGGTGSGFVETMKLDLPALDAVLPGGGLRLGALHEIGTAATVHLPHDGAALGFTLWLLGRLARRSGGPVLWCRRQGGAFAGQPYGPGLLPFLDPGRVLLAEAARAEDVLWAMEEGARCRALAGVLGEVRGMDLTASRRLMLAAEATGVTVLALRLAAGGSSAAMTRWRVEAASSRSTPGLNDVGRPRWRVALQRARGVLSETINWTMEWSDETGDLVVVSAPGDGQAGAPVGALAHPPGGHHLDRVRRAASGGGE